MSNVRSSPGIIIETTGYGPLIRFFVKNLSDQIQNHHANGLFYEIEELGIIERHFPRGGSYLDIGSNVGNHLVFVAAARLAGEMIAIEPNPKALEILRYNLLLNALTTVDIQHLGLGLSDNSERASVHTLHPNNLGGTEMVASPEGPIQLDTGDQLFTKRQIDFIEMDVEGLEMKVLRGLEQTIAKSRPVMFIEVGNTNRADFDQWLAGHNYQTAQAYRRYSSNENFLVRPEEKPLVELAA